MSEMYRLDEKNWPLERLWKATGKVRGRYLGDVCLGMYEKWGDEAIELIGKVYANAADRTFLKGLRSFGIEGRGADALAMFFVISQSAIGYDMEIVELSEKRSVVRYHSCHIFPDPSPAAEQICRRANFQFEVRAAELLNPKLRVYYNKVRSGGAPYCEWVCELEE